MAIGTLESPHMPDLVLDKILRFLPTKAAVQGTFLSKQWQGVVSSFPTLNFNEHDNFDRHGLGSSVLYQHQHHRFINFLEGYLDFHNKNRRKDQPLYKLSLHMRTYLHQDAEIITKWLKYACQKGLKELDICPEFDPKLDELQILTVTEHLMYWNSGVYVGVQPLFPSLKILSFKAVRIATDQALCSVLRACPSIEYLSLTYSSIENSKCYACCSSLKYLEVKFCEVDDIRINQAFNLESFTFVSLRDSECENMILNNAVNLKYINISVDRYIGEFSLLGCHRALEATIKCKRIHRFEFFDGYLSAKLSFKADRNQARIDQATILVGEFMDQELFSPDSTYVPSLVSFIKSFRGCKTVNFYIEEFQALTVPKNYRKMSCLSLLPKTSALEVRIPKLSLFGSRDHYDELVESLRWISQSAIILTRSVDVEEERRKVDQRARASPADHR